MAWDGAHYRSCYNRSVDENITGDSLSRKDQVDVILHEYDALHKELDEDIRYLSTLGITILLAMQPVCAK